MRSWLGGEVGKGEKRERDRSGAGGRVRSGRGGEMGEGRSGRGVEVGEGRERKERWSGNKSNAHDVDW